MNSPFRAFWHIASRFPGDIGLAAALTRLLWPTERQREFTLGLIQSRVRARSVMRLSRMINEFVEIGYVTRYIRVESPGGGGIGRFNSISDVPASLYDPFEDREFVVEPDDLQVIFETAQAEREVDTVSAQAEPA